MKIQFHLDKLEVAFKKNEVLQNHLNTNDKFESYEFLLVRNRTESNYKNNFDIYYIDGSKFGNLYFGSYNINRQLIYISITNENLYNDKFKYIVNLQEQLNLEFHQISRIDFANDCNINAVNKFYKLLKNEDYDIIILNKSIKIDDNINDLLNISQGTRKNIHKFKSFYIQNKEKGLVLNCYDKKKEIEDNNNAKSYILDHFNYKEVYRIEVRTNHHLLIDSLNSLGFTDDYLYYIIINSIFDELYLLFENLLNRLIRIKYKKDVYSLIDLLQ